MRTYQPAGNLATMTDNRKRRPQGACTSASGWNAASALRTAARRHEAARATLERLVIEAYRQGLGVREIARHVHRSHAWVIATLKSHGVYESGAA